MNILFVISSFIRIQAEYYELPLGVLYIATVLKKYHNIKIIDMNKYPEDSPILEEYLNENNIDIMCTGGLSAFYFAIEHVIQVTKKTNPNIITVLGGGIVTSDKELICTALDPDLQY